jgi:FMN phosphatase YigB (HAD superfamily)
MRVLYYLEAFRELGNPLFRFATVRNHLEHEIRGLLKSTTGHVQVTLLCSEAVALAIRAHRLLPEAQLVAISQAELERVYPSYEEASARWYNRDFAARQLERMLDLCARKLADFEPDVIVCYESSAPFLEALFPDALLLHDTLGMFSRAPYPETSVLDPFGIGKDAFVRRYAAQLRATQLTTSAQRQLQGLKEAYRSAQLAQSPLQPCDVRKRFERVVLLPLQVSRYFMFDENCPPELRGANQLDFLRYVLERVERDVGVYVTMHGREAALFTPRVLAQLARRFPNLLFSERVQLLPWPSQHALPHVDAVVTVSSSVGLQALIWDLPVVVLGRSHVAGVASSDCLAELPALLAQGKTQHLDGALYYLLTHYYPLMDRYHHQGDWFQRFLERGIEHKRRGLDFDFYAPIDDPERVMSALIHDLRPERYAFELRRSSAGRSPTDQELTRSIASADVVSFDVFDTLVTRPLSHPRALFELLAPKASALFEAHALSLRGFGDFRRLREDAALQAADEARASGVEEYRLLAVYEALCARVGAPAGLAVQLKQLEEEVELAIHLPRQRGRLLFELAARHGKRIVLLSDIFLDAAVVADILRRCGYTEHQRLYVSSEHGLLKKTGRLYEHVGKLEGRPRNWLHVGDNYLVDVQMPARQGIRAHHLPSITDLYAKEPHVREIWRHANLGEQLGAALQHGVISRKFYDRPATALKRARFEGSPYRLGYEAGGPLMLAFVQWIAEKARRDKVTDLYFLARDGHLPKQVYELIAAATPGAAKAHYLYASRRAYSVASLRSVRDVVASLDLKSGAMTLADVLRYRFGIDPEQIIAGSLEAEGFASDQDRLDLREPAQRKRLERFLVGHAALILGQAAEERADLLDYLGTQGVLDPSRSIALVDIGHNASLQVALAALTERNDCRGYYFATFYPAREAYLAGHDISSYLLEFEESRSSEHVYCQNVGLFEFLFLPALPSLARMQRAANGELQPKFVAGDESGRFRVIEEVHRGVLDFCRDVVRASFGQPWLFQISKNDAIREFAHFAVHPDRDDAALLDGIGFVDRFGGFPTRYLIAPARSGPLNTFNFAEHERESWWKNGARALTNVGPRFHSRAGVQGRRRKLLKLLRDPRRFVRDMKLANSLRRLLAGLPGTRG